MQNIFLNLFNKISALALTYSKIFAQFPRNIFVKKIPLYNQKSVWGHFRYSRIAFVLTFLFNFFPEMKKVFRVGYQILTRI